MRKRALGPVSRKSRNFSGVNRVTLLSLYLQNEGVLRHETLQLFLFLFPLQHMKRPALQNKQVAVLRMAFRARKVLGTFEKRAPGVESNYSKRLGRSNNENGGLNASVCVHVCFAGEDCVQAIWSTDQMGKEIAFPFVDE